MLLVHELQRLHVAICDAGLRWRCTAPGNDLDSSRLRSPAALNQILDRRRRNGERKRKHNFAGVIPNGVMQTYPD